MMRKTPLGLLVAALFAASSAHAQDTERADSLFKQGQELLDAGKVTQACPLFAESHRLDPKLGRLLNLAYCHEQEGKTATAWSEYNDASALATQRAQAERAEFARTHADEIAKKLSYLRLDFPKGRETIAEIVLDSIQLPRDKWGVPIPVDPGKHTVEARASERVPRTVSFDIAAAPGTTPVMLDSLEIERSTGTQTEDAPRSRGMFYAALGAAGAGVVGLGLGATFGILASSKKGDADPHCPMKACDPIGASSLSDARTFATVSTVGLVVGGAFAVASVVLFLIAPRGSAERKHARIVPLVGPAVGLAGAW